MVLKRLFSLLFLFVPVLSYAFAPVCEVARRDTLATCIMSRVGDVVTDRLAGVESLSARLYIKEYVDAEKKNLLLNLLPNMTHFDKGEASYLAELFYDVRYVYDMMPEIKRVASLSTFERSSGEMDLVMSFMTPQLYGRLLFGEEFLSPLNPANYKYYVYSIDASVVENSVAKVSFKARYDNVMLLEKGTICIDAESMLPVEVVMEGRNEDGRFRVTYKMGADEHERYLVKEIALLFDYDFVYNRLDIDVYACFDYTALCPRTTGGKLERRYNLTLPDVPLDMGDESYVAQHRKRALTSTDSLMYRKRDAHKMVSDDGAIYETPRLRGIRNMMWRVADGAMSSHSLAWGDSDIKIYPFINPSYLSYSSNRGLAYRLSLNLNSRLSQNVHLYVRPFIGYNFKWSEFYWGVKGGLQFAPMRHAVFTFDIGRDASTYSSVEIGRIKNMPLDSIDFAKMPLVRYRDMHIKGDFRFEVANGLDLSLGASYYRRSMSGGVVGFDDSKMELERCYRQFAPNVRLSWQPDMYYYINDGRKINLGSRAPRFAVDVEQGVKGLFASDGRYTRLELDVQYRRVLPSNASLYFRAGTGGYICADDLYFINYSFLKDNNLPLDKDDELSGVFNLLDREWYSSANRYVRANISYESHFLFLQRLIPSVRFVRSETLYGGVLFISHLCPYTEYGYGVETPYLNMGFFFGFENLGFHRIGYKLSFSLFGD